MRASAGSLAVLEFIFGSSFLHGGDYLKETSMGRVHGIMKMLGKLLFMIG